MRKVNILLAIALAAAMAASFTFGQETVSAQGWAPTGIVVEYNPGRSITIEDQNGTQQQYTISSTVRILPPVRSYALAVGSFVTIVSPASLSQGKQMAVAIVVHPYIPPAWNAPSLSETPPTTGSAVKALTATAVDTPLASETAGTGTQPATETAAAAETPAGTATPIGIPMSTETPIVTPTATAVQTGEETIPSVDSFIAWVRSLFQ